MNDADPKRISWLLEFLERDVAFDGDGRITTIRPGQMLDLCTDIELYLLGPTADSSGLLTASNSEEEVHRDRVLAEFQATLRRGMEQLAADGRWSVSEELWVHGVPRDRRVGWALERQEDGTLRRWYEGAPVDALLLAAASDLVTQWWPQLRRCKYPDCGAWFLPSDKRQLYHEPVCRHRNFARMRERDYAEEHAARIEKTKGRGPAKRLRKKQARKKARRKGGKQ